MKALKLFTALGLIMGWMGSAAQNLSNRGKEFWVGYGHHQFMEPGQPNSQEMVLYFSAEQAANVTVSINGTTWIRNYAVAANSVISTEALPKAGTNDCRLYSVPPSFGGTGGEGIFTRGIHIVSDVPIVAYAHIYGSLSSGATMLMPVETWGYAYASINSAQNYGNNNCFSWLYVVAKENNTVIEITPSVLTRNGRAAGVPFTATLNKGEIYQVIGASLTASTGRELTGTRVKSIANGAGECHPIGVFAGSSRTAITCPTGGGGSGDNIMQQIFPFQAWGKRYLTAPFAHQNNPSQANGGVIRVAVKEPGTVVKRNGTTLTGINGNFYYEFQSNQPEYIEADKPILVAQYMPSSGQCGYSGNGDPEMIYVSPIEQAIKRIGFFRNNAEAINTNYLNLIVPEGGTGLSSLRIDGQPLSAIPATLLHTYPHPRLPGYRIVVRKWNTGPGPAPGQCIVSGDSAFTAITYGLGSVESYGYNAGTFINNLSAVSSIRNNLDPTRPEHEFTCTNSPFELSVLMAYQPTKMVWKLSQLGAALSPNADVTVNAPVSSGTVVLNGITYYKYTIPGSYQFNAPGIYDIPIAATHPSIENCNNTETVKVEVQVKTAPLADFSFTHSTGCSLDTVYLNAASATSNGYTVRAWSWDFPGGATATGKDTLHLFAPGADQDIKLTVVTTEGCRSDITKEITVLAPPVAIISGDASFCEGTSASFTPSGTYGGTAPIIFWDWDFGNGMTSTGSTSTQTITYDDYGQFTVKLVVGVSLNCQSQPAEYLVNVNARPQVNISFPVGCLPADGVVQFTNTTSVPNGQPITSHSWNFGDANATPANPNTSTAVSPSHIYTAYGNYSILYTATSAQGCVTDSLIQTTFNLAPQFSYPALPAICANAPAVSVATASVTNGVPGTGIYKGPGTSDAGSFNPAAAGAGVHTIWYVYTAGSGCKDSISQSITVHAVPVASFTTAAGACLAPGGTAEFINNSTISDGQTLSYTWNFGDPNATPGNPNTSTAQNGIHNFGEGSFNIKLEVLSSNGCVKDTTVNMSFGITPVLAYPALAPVCESAAAFSIASASVTNGLAGNGTYSGPGMSANGTFDPATAGAGIHTITYSFTSAGGCTSTTTSSIEVYPRPVSSFTVAPDVCLGQSLTFTNTSTIPSGTIQTWSWNFGNGNTPSNPNGNPVVVDYAAANTYTVQLTTLSDRGCVSTPFSRQVIVRPLPVADFVVPTGICFPGPALFENRSTAPDNSTLSYQWNFGDNLGSSLSQSPSYTYGSAGSYDVTLTAKSAFGCTNAITKTVQDFYDKPIAGFTVTPEELCQGAETIFADGSTAPNSSITSWSWNFDDGSPLVTTQVPVKKYNNAGTYDVSLTVKNAVGCSSDPFVKTVIVHLQPRIDAGPSFVVAEGKVIQLQATANSADLDFSWSPPTGLSDPTALKPTLTALSDQTYVLTATGDYGCTAVDSITVKILRTVNAPNVFTPNGDGIHDRWLIPNLRDYVGCTVEIFNRYGQQVFYSQGYNTPWDGRFKGADLPGGTYYYVIRLENGFKPITGSVTLIR